MKAEAVERPSEECEWEVDDGWSTSSELLGAPQLPTFVYENALSTETTDTEDSPMWSSDCPVDVEFETLSEACTRKTKFVGKPANRTPSKTQARAQRSAGVTPEESALKLALDIWDSICIDDELHWEFEDWVSLFETLPMLIVVLATRLSTGDAKITSFRQGQLEAMREACSAVLKGLVPDNSARKGIGEATPDKIDLWRRKLREGHAVDGAFGPVYGTEGKRLNEDSGLAEAVHIWLIARFLKDLLLHQDESHSQDSIRRMRRAILGRADFVGALNSYHVSSTITIAFFIPTTWSKSEPERDNPAPGEFGARWVLVASGSDQIQATTIRQYLDQAWPFGGAKLLRFFESEFQHSSRTTLTLPSGTRIEATKSPSGRTIQATGDPHFVSEVGEQLSWLVAAAQPGPDSIAHRESHPVVSPLDVKLLRQNFASNPHYLWGLQAGSRPLESSSTLSLLHRIQLRGSLLRSVPYLLRGYPTAWRPSDCPGVEMSSEVMFDSIRPQQLNVTWDSVHLQGKDVMLKLISKPSDVLFWHVRFSGSCCICRPRNFQGHWSMTSLSSLWRHRHVISSCNDSKAKEPGDSAPDDPETGAYESSDGLEDTPSLAESSQTTGDASSLSEESPGNSSIATSALSISNSPETALVQTREVPDDLLPLVETVAGRLLEEYRRSTGSPSIVRCAAGSNTPSTRTGILQSSSSSVVTPSSPVQIRKAPHKRVNFERNEDDESDEETRKRPPKRQKPTSPSNAKPTKFLACPFWKLNPNEHRSCFKLALDGIARVKQHLNRKHAPMWYCPSCLIIFPDEPNYDQHVRSGTCSHQPCKFNGITHQQQRKISKRSKPNTTDSERWFVIWDIVFPDQTRPASAYMDSELSEDLSRFKEFAQARGPAVMAAEIQANCSAADPGPVLEAAISRGFDVLFETWLAERGSPREQTATPTDPDPSPSETQPSLGTTCSMPDETPPTPGLSQEEKQADTQSQVSCIEEKQRSSVVQDSETPFLFDDDFLGIDWAFSDEIVPLDMPVLGMDTGDDMVI